MRCRNYVIPLKGTRQPFIEWAAIYIMRLNDMNSKHVLWIGCVLVACLILREDAMAASRTGLHVIDVNGQPYVTLNSLMRYYGFENRRSGTEQVALVRGPDQLELTLNSRRARWNGVVIWLHEPVVLHRRDWVVPSVDVQAVLGPLLRPSDALVGIGRKRVLIDPGHGGRDEGARGSLGTLEKDLTLTLSRKVAARLRSAGIDVMLTREVDKALTLVDRMQLVLDHEADLFVSVHFNAAANTAARGIETFVLTAGGHRNTGNQGEGPFAPARDANEFDGANQVLAYLVQRRMLERTQAEDRGVRRSRFYVLREATVPSILIEGGFLSHAPEERNLMRPDYQNALAEGIARGILEYLAAVARAELEPVL